MLLQIHEPGEGERSKEKAGAVVGIDFGTTHCAVAISYEGKVEMVPLEGEVLTPSVIDYGLELSVGKEAQEGDHPIRSIKRLLQPKEGRELEDMVVGHMVKTPIEIASDIFRYLKREAEKTLGQPMTGAVITVPAYYKEGAREATRKAAQLAGLPVLRLLNEPTAAALAYELDEREEGCYLIYDLGGGTFDVSLLSLEKGVFQVLAVGGDTFLGGDDLDGALGTYLALPEHGGLVLARTIKEHLSHHSFWKGTVGEKVVTVTQEEFNVLLHPYIEKTLKVCDGVLKESGVSRNALKEVVLVGGATRMPYLQKRLSDFFERTPLCSLNPEEVVALGAALHADALKTGVGKLLLDVTPFSLGIETLGGAVEVLIPRNAPLPSCISEKFTTSHDGQTKIKIHVVQGEGKNVADCHSLTTFVLGNLPPLPAGHVTLKVTFTLDADGILSVSAEEQNSGLQRSIQVTPTYEIE